MKPTAVTLTVIKGWQEGQWFFFDEPGQYTVGRGNDCTFHFPTETWYRDVSRHHCVFDIDPPTIWLRDLGSLNGTYLNGEKIGQRDPKKEPEDSHTIALIGHELQPGDEVQVGDTVFRVGMTVSCAVSESVEESVQQVRFAE
jgi:pSer/pThr/pTyr-binding forkhead associated (FHA) protein